MRPKKKRHFQKNKRRHQDSDFYFGPGNHPRIWWKIFDQSDIPAEIIIRKEDAHHENESECSDAYLSKELKPE